MNSFKYVFLVVFSCMSIAAFSQKTLQLTNKKSGKIKTFKVGQTFNYRLNPADEFEKAKIQNITDNTLVLFLPNEDEGSNLVEPTLSEIHSFRKASCFHKLSQGIGTFLILGGAYVMATSPSLAGDENSAGPYIGLGAGMLVLGTIPYFINPKTYVLGEKYTAEIK